ncbi:MAG: trypsin-like peptidase domain-containing protein [Thermostichus sp. DG02_5_bins_236]
MSKSVLSYPVSPRFSRWFSVGLLTLGLLGLRVHANSIEVLPSQFNREEQASIDVYQAASPAVVTIGNGRSTGSGTFIRPEGLILTNEHVVRGSRNGQVRVRTTDGSTYIGEVIAVDRPNDLALVRLRDTGGATFPTVPLASESGIRVGQQVYAIGSPFGLSGTLTTGILSRIAPNGDLQTDAAINPGNSGGPLLNSRGELIGVNKAILTSGRGNLGIGFATSATVARAFIEENLFASAGRSPYNAPRVASQPTGPRLGVAVDPQTLVIHEVQTGSLASRIGLQPGDRLVGLNGRRLANLEQLLNYLDTQPQSAWLTIGRGRQLAEIPVQF